MLMGLGGNPYGPAGTGKTESVKALGGLFGRQVLWFLVRMETASRKTEVNKKIGRLAEKRFMVKMQ